MFKRTLIALGTLGVTAATQAAEEEKLDWTGLYMGLGLETTKAKVSVNPDPSGIILFDNLEDLSGNKADWAGTIQFGFRKEFGKLVLGAELEGIFGGGRTITDSTDGLLFEDAPDFLTLSSEATVSVKPKGRMVGTVEVPIGKHFLIGGEAGFTLATTSVSGEIYGPYNFFDSTIREHWASYSDTSNQIGGTYGIRATAKVGKHMLITARYTFAKLGTATAPVTLDELEIIDMPVVQAAEAVTKLESFRLGVGYQF
ncbi:outer membrane beta-barrel protein [Kordiimonas pumila]|uniref:Outer membrane beta-barrel protein n=1 Tax=Kordiimonas pumila TaxID=2161677 RepID=A0ABV7D9V9_9PROT|nr:outer membrane beta-barrel protein [Kordiimonas pumila]